MNILPVLNINTNKYQLVSPSFSAKGKPITLQYVVERRSSLLPPRVLERAKQLVAECPQAHLPSLLEIHREVYAPLAECKTLDEAKALFPEFASVKETVDFERDSVYARKFKERTDKNFALTMLKEFWVNLKNKEDVAKALGMPSRSSLDWIFKQINFVSYPNNYKTLLKASDEEGNRLIASKVSAWNAAHPDLMYQHNKHAAQGCKTIEYRLAQSARMKKYDIENPERREKISVSITEAWDKCPQIKDAMKLEIEQKPYIRPIMMKKAKGDLTEQETILLKQFYKNFWDAHPEFKQMFSEARQNLQK